MRNSENTMVVTRVGKGTVGEMLVKGYKISVSRKKFKRSIVQHVTVLGNNVQYT
jgi:hypothetical protein